VVQKNSVLSAVTEGAGGKDDSPEHEALFDSVVAQSRSAATPKEPIAEDWDGQAKAFNTVGQMVRQLHDALLGLGYDKLIEKTVSTLPDAKDRLAYVASLTEQAACSQCNRCCDADSGADW
jgi:chemotaxis protein CheZ